MDAFGKHYALIVPGGILKKFYLYKEDEDSSFTKVGEFKTDVKMGKAAVWQNDYHHVYILKADADIVDTQIWTAYSMTAEDSLEELSIEFEGNASSKYPSSNYDIYVRGDSVYSISKHAIIGYEIQGVADGKLKLKELLAID